MRSLCIRLLAACAMMPAAMAQPEKTSHGVDWPMYAGNLASTKYSPLSQINAKNVGQLALAWSYRLAERGAFETTPIVVDGVMYLPAGNKVVALNPQNGKEVWSYLLPEGQPGTQRSGVLAER